MATYGRNGRTRISNACGAAAGGGGGGAARGLTEAQKAALAAAKELQKLKETIADLDVEMGSLTIEGGEADKMFEDLTQAGYGFKDVVLAKASDALGELSLKAKEAALVMGEVTKRGWELGLGFTIGRRGQEGAGLLGDPSAVAQATKGIGGKWYQNELLKNIVSTAAGAIAGGGGLGGVMQGVLPIIGTAVGGPVGGAIGGLLGSLFGKKKRGEMPSSPVYVHVVNQGDLVTAFLNLTKQLRLIATGPGQAHVTGQLMMQAARVGVS